MTDKKIEISKFLGDTGKNIRDLVKRIVDENITKNIPQKSELEKKLRGLKKDLEDSAKSITDRLIKKEVEIVKKEVKRLKDVIEDIKDKTKKAARGVAITSNTKRTTKKSGKAKKVVRVKTVTAPKDKELKDLQA